MKPLGDTSRKPNWKTIREMAVAGLSFPQLAKRCGASLAAIKKRSSREKWPVPARIMRRARELSPHVTDEVVTDMAENLLHEGTVATCHAMKILRLKLARAVANPASIADLRDVQGVVTALKGARLAAGLDKAESAQFTFIMPGWVASVAPLHSDAGFSDGYSVGQFIEAEDTP
jgi:hypothetical protein